MNTAPPLSPPIGHTPVRFCVWTTGVRRLPSLFRMDMTRFVATYPVPVRLGEPLPHPLVSTAGWPVWVDTTSMPVVPRCPRVYTFGAFPEARRAEMSPYLVEPMSQLS